MNLGCTMELMHPAASMQIIASVIVPGPVMEIAVLRL